jgi:hypothetical protein
MAHRKQCVSLITGGPTNGVQDKRFLTYKCLPIEPCEPNCHFKFGGRGKLQTVSGLWVTFFFVSDSNFNTFNILLIERELDSVSRIDQP